MRVTFLLVVRCFPLDGAVKNNGGGAGACQGLSETRQVRASIDTPNDRMRKDDPGRSALTVRNEDSGAVFARRFRKSDDLLCDSITVTDNRRLAELAGNKFCETCRGENQNQ